MVFDESLCADDERYMREALLEAEQAVLGAILINPEMISVALDIIKPEHFHLEHVFPPLQYLD